MVSPLASWAVMLKLVELVAPADHVPAAGSELLRCLQSKTNLA
jgi:hypothetical protein